MTISQPASDDHAPFAACGGPRADSHSMTPQARTLRARIAAHESWAQTADPAARTAPGRAAFRELFERRVDPDGLLSPEERARRAEQARKAHYVRMALRSAQSRRRRGGRRKPADSDDPD